MSSDNLLVSSADFTELETALDRGAIGTVGRMVPRTSDIALSGLSRRLLSDQRRAVHKLGTDARHDQCKSR